MRITNLKTKINWNFDKSPKLFATFLSEQEP